VRRDERETAEDAEELAAVVRPRFTQRAVTDSTATDCTDRDATPTDSMLNGDEEGVGVN
jgi:hypothetical protein